MIVVEESKIKQIESALALLKEVDLIYTQSEITIMRWIEQQRSAAAEQERQRLERGKAMYQAYCKELNVSYPSVERAWALMHKNKRQAWMVAAEYAAHWKAAE
ncbi:hypothetical protein FDI69_gp169 [Rhodococcus phage Trina]|uniref:Uncharacterized protein n=1 Tax=Rhodococcus phage Trina TaxID=2027905 RepID=A0A2D1AEA3_9CAUD|nr:hypothetical protein FDI69_gp169 [Rhodococcus phage Trina]ASZ75017.1 hypothetical protein SEA_TRINA_238 [Rhodococcus phage Trina]